MHKHLINNSFLGLCLKQTIEQLNLQNYQQKLEQCLVNAFNSNIQANEMNSSKSNYQKKIQTLQGFDNYIENITVSANEIERKEAPYEQNNNKYQHMKGILSEFSFDQEGVKNISIVSSRNNSIPQTSYVSQTGKGFIQLSQQKNYAIIDLIGQNSKGKSINLAMSTKRKSKYQAKNLRHNKSKKCKKKLKLIKKYKNIVKNTKKEKKQTTNNKKSKM